MGPDSLSGKEHKSASRELEIKSQLTCLWLWIHRRVNLSYVGWEKGCYRLSWRQLTLDFSCFVYAAMDTLSWSWAHRLESWACVSDDCEPHCHF